MVVGTVMGAMGLLRRASRDGGGFAELQRWEQGLNPASLSPQRAAVPTACCCPTALCRLGETLVSSSPGCPAG